MKKHNFDPTQSRRDFPSPENYRIGNPSITPSEYELMGKDERYQAVRESLVASDEHEDENRLEAAKNIMSRIDTLMEGRLRDLGGGEYIGEGEWLLLSDKYPAAVRRAEEGYSIKEEEVSLWVRRMGDSVHYASTFFRSDRIPATKPIHITVDKEGSVTIMKAREREGELEVPASALQLKAASDILNPKPDSGKRLQAFDSEREVIESHPRFLDQVRIRPKSIFRKLVKGLAKVK